MDATTDDSESVWRSVCFKLAAELESFGGPSGSDIINIEKVMELALVQNGAK